MLMLSATQIYTIFTVQLFAFLNLLPVEADIVAVSRTMHRNMQQQSLIDETSGSLKYLESKGNEA